MEPINLKPPAVREASTRAIRDKTILIGGLALWAAVTAFVPVIVLVTGFGDVAAAPAALKQELLSIIISNSIVIGAACSTGMAVTLAIWAIVTAKRRTSDRTMVALYESSNSSERQQAEDLAREAHRLSQGDPTVEEAVRRAVLSVGDLGENTEAIATLLDEMGALNAALERSRSDSHEDAIAALRAVTEVIAVGDAPASDQNAARAKHATASRAEQQSQN